MIAKKTMMKISIQAGVSTNTTGADEPPAGLDRGAWVEGLPISESRRSRDDPLSVVGEEAKASSPAESLHARSSLISSTLSASSLLSDSDIGSDSVSDYESEFSTLL